MLFHFKFEVDPVHVYVHNEHSSEGLAQILRQLSKMEKFIMATAAEFTAGFARIDTATTAIAELIRALVAQQQQGGMTPEEEAAAHAKLLGIADTLEAMAATPTDPVPVPVPTP